MKTINVFTLLSMVAVFASCGGNSSTKENIETGVSVNVKEIRLVEVPKIFHYTGTVSSVNQSTLSTRLMGQISKVLVHEGDEVTKGQLLVTIRSNDIVAKEKQVEANIIEVKAAYEHAHDNYNRIKTLYAKKSATKKELDDITVHYEMLKAKLNAAQKGKEEVEEMLSYANIRAPYAGVVTQRFVDTGDMANPGMPLLAIEAAGLFEVNARIPESEIHNVEKEDTVEVRIDACKEPVSGIISSVSPSSRFSGSQFEARILLLPNDAQKASIRSGVFANINHFKGSEEKILVPEKSIINRGQLQGIWTVGTSGQALLRWVRLGKTYGNNIEILSGINEGTQIITTAKGRLHDGISVQIN